jgi:ribosomal protein S12 methylthiotransferase RimO
LLKAQDFCYSIAIFSEETSYKMALKLFTPTTESVETKPTETQAPGTLHIPKRGNKIYFVSLGCPRNLVDSEVMLGILLQAGYEVADDLKKADYIVINTCGFLEEARSESSQAVEDALKTKKKEAKLIVTGCMVQTHSNKLKERFGEVDYYLGSGHVDKILEAVLATEKGEAITSAKSFLEAGETPRQLSTPKHFAYLKIAEGCRKRCSFCVIPDIKGPLQSKSEEQILKELKLFLSRGVKEIVLIAQDLGDWGKDILGRNRSGLYDLLKKMLASTDQHFWLRLLYLYPDEITDELIEIIKSDPRVCPYLDMPIQHVSDRVLKLMRRTVNKETIVTTLAKLRKEIPSISIRTSLMVGFPGETEEDFAELLAFVKAHPLDNCGVFKYSKEEGSHSFTLPDHVSEEDKEERYHRLMQAQQAALLKHNRRWIGKVIPVMVEGYHPETKLLMQGRHQGQCPEIDGVVLINDPRGVNAFGTVYSVKITEVSGYDLVGKVVTK